MCSMCLRCSSSASIFVLMNSSWARSASFRKASLFLREPDLRVQFVPLDPMLGRVVDEGADLRVERIALLDPLPRLVVQFVAAPAVPFRFLVFSLPLQLQLIQQGNPHASGWSGFARRRLPYKTSRPRPDSPEGTAADNGVATSNSAPRISASVLCPTTHCGSG